MDLKFKNVLEIKKTKKIAPIVENHWNGIIILWWTVNLHG